MNEKNIIMCHNDVSIGVYITKCDIYMLNVRYLLKLSTPLRK